MLEVEYRKTAELIPYARNSRTHSDEQVSQIMASITEFGFTNPILIDEKNEIIAGHGRLIASQRLKLEKVPCIVLDNLTEAQKKAYVIADNKLALNAGWNEELLKVEIEELIADGFNIDLLGFSEIEFEEMDISFDDIGDLDTDKADEVPEIEENPVIKLGDLIELGHNYQHRLLCGDSTKDEDVARLMDGKKADMVFTDPPWNVNYGAVKDDNPMGYKPRTILNDFMGTEDFKKFMFDVFKNMSKHSKKGCMTYVVMSAQEWGNMMLTLSQNNYHWSSTIIWNKDRHVMSRKDYHTKYEPIWYGWLDASRLKPLEDRKQSDVWDIPRPTSSEIHPTTKPVELVEKAVYNSSNTKDIILDLFGGSGTTMIACENISRKARLNELDPKYAQAIIQRYVDYTSNPKIKINGVERDWHEYKDSMDR